ncbi:uncharacterized protein BJ171DRAFT_477921 [Polychytrium aggregatum]|uniref:uncharacterized protein n=1 Tax=Polychytrium aggregatum TaxID=110093 RepID=UPI0022FDCFFD|nr:uncharacterized protein BJ171DRAFT_477921 [Polychytrium aggregatum]KAI9197389.1 hypothetical protein BJ171DRAFT_477921 [Polychytrium aggregatum]
MSLHSSWLLRLFESEFFDSRLAIQYLHRYPDSVGIQHYICNRLNEFPQDEIEFLLPQLCHLLLTKSSASVALEDFLMSQCERSHHMAILSWVLRWLFGCRPVPRPSFVRSILIVHSCSMLGPAQQTLWYLKAAINDVRVNPQSRTFRVGSRIYHRCQSIVFADLKPNEPSRVPEYPTFHIQPNAKPVLVGMGMILAGVASPALTQSTHSMILSQARKFCSWLPSFWTQASTGEEEGRLSLGARTSTAVSASSAEPRGESAVVASIKAQSRFPVTSPSLEDLHQGSAFSFDRYVEKTSQALGMQTPRTNSSAASLHEHSPQLRPEVGAQHLTESLVHSHYFHSQLQFVMTLVDIGDRLRSVPKPARQNSLIAELELLNHNLPAEVCIPMWCPANSTVGEHHRIVRISSEDSVVLNSADRVPYLIVVEVLEHMPTPIASENISHIELADAVHFEAADHPSDIDSDVAGAVKAVSAPEQLGIVTPPTTTPRTSDSPAQEHGDSNSTSVPDVPNSSPADHSGRASSLQYHQEIQDRRHNALQNIKVDEFSERMRTAAVMLSQLYHQQQREADSSAASAGKGDSNPSTPKPARRDTLSRRNASKSSADYENIRKRIIVEMTALEERRMSALQQQTASRAAGKDSGTQVAEVEDGYLVDGQTKEIVYDVIRKDKEDPSAAVFRETWEAKEARIRASSPYGKYPDWTLLSVIVKSGADLRQEQLALQLIRECQMIWDEAKCPAWVHNFRILVTSDQSGLVETIRNSISIHSIKKEGYSRKQHEEGAQFTLYDYFIQEFGHPDSESFRQAQDCFMRSLAGYSVICHLFQIKDRHNGNILLDNQGHCIHIDFGFMLTNSPGSVGFELAPFKLPQEYIDILGGLGSDKFKEFRSLLKQAFLALRKKYEQIVVLVEMMEKVILTHIVDFILPINHMAESTLPCFTGASQKPTTVYIPPTASSMLPFFSKEGGAAGGHDAVAHAAQGLAGQQHPAPLSATSSSSSISAQQTTAHQRDQYPVSAALQERFQLILTDKQVSELVDRLVDSSCNNVFTRLYDAFQRYCIGAMS